MYHYQMNTFIFLGGITVIWITTITFHCNSTSFLKKAVLNISQFLPAVVQDHNFIFMTSSSRFLNWHQCVHTWTLSFELNWLAWIIRLNGGVLGLGAYLFCRVHNRCQFAVKAFQQTLELSLKPLSPVFWNNP